MTSALKGALTPKAGFRLIPVSGALETLGSILEQDDGPPDALVMGIGRLSGGMRSREYCTAVLRACEQWGISSTILLLPAEAGIADVLEGLRLGAADCLISPVSACELAARLKAILRRTLPADRAPQQTYQIGQFRVNFCTHEAFLGGEPVQMSALDFRLLRYLIRHEGQVVSHEQLLRDVWELPPDILTRRVEKQIRDLRKKIEADPQRPRFLETCHGVGYQLAFRADTALIAPEPPASRRPRRIERLEPRAATSHAVQRATETRSRTRSKDYS